MSGIDLVVGAESIDVRPDDLRLITTAGEHRTIPWNSIRLAGFADGSLGIPIESHAHSQTHSTLWLYLGESLAQLMIEKGGPSRSEIAGNSH